MSAHEAIETRPRPVPIAGIALRVCPELPPTTEERITDHRAQTYADSVMYRQALAAAAEVRGWSVHWYDRERVFSDAAAALGKGDIQAFLSALGKALGPPWQARHKLAAAAALAAQPSTSPVKPLTPPAKPSALRASPSTPRAKRRTTRR